MRRSSTTLRSQAAASCAALLLGGCVVAAAGAGAGGGIYFTQRGVESVVPVTVERAATATTQAFGQLKIRLGPGNSAFDCIHAVPRNEVTHSTESIPDSLFALPRFVRGDAASIYQSQANLRRGT